MQTRGSRGDAQFGPIASNPKPELGLVWIGSDIRILFWVHFSDEAGRLARAELVSICCRIADLRKPK